MPVVAAIVGGMATTRASGDCFSAPSATGTPPATRHDRPLVVRAAAAHVEAALVAHSAAPPGVAAVAPGLRPAVAWQLLPRF